MKNVKQRAAGRNERVLLGETNDEETQEWRDDMTAEEAKLIDKWDEIVYA